MKAVLRRAGLAAVLAALIALPCDSLAQYLYLDSDGDGLPSSADKVNIPGGTDVSIWLRTDLNRDGTAATCSGGGPLTLTSYAVSIAAENGRVSWGQFNNAQAATMAQLAMSSSDSSFYVLCGGSTPLAPGTYKLGTVPMLVVEGSPRLTVEAASTSGGVQRTSFGSGCAGIHGDNTLDLGEEWQDADGLAAAPQTVIFSETWDGSGGGLPTRWVSTATAGSDLWNVNQQSTCGYSIGEYSVSAVPPPFCSSYLSGMNNVLRLKDADLGKATRLTDYRLAMRYRHRLGSSVGGTNDVASVGLRSGSINSYFFTDTQFTNEFRFTSLGEWPKYESGEIANDNFENNYFTPLFGLFTVTTSPADGNRWGYWVDTVQVYGTSRADLAVSPPVTAAPASGAQLFTGQAWVLSYELKNLGDTDSPGFDVMAWLQDGSGNLVFVDTFFEFPIAARDSMPVIHTVPASKYIPPGTYRLKLKVDPNGSITESEPNETPETNNDYLGGSSYTWSLPPAPDLVVQSLTVTNPTPTLGESVSIAATVKNVGTAAAPACTLGYYANRGAAPTGSTAPDQVAAMPGLGIGASSNASFVVANATPATWQSWVLADRSGVVSEDNTGGTAEQNNAGGPLSIIWAPGNVTVRGRFAYDDSLTVTEVSEPCLHIIIYDNDFGVSEDDSVAFANTDAEGNFVSTPIVNFDSDAPAGDDTRLDLYARVYYKTHQKCWGEENPNKWAVIMYRQMVPGFPFVEWSYDGSTSANASDGLLEVGLLKPAASDHRAAMHILRTLTNKGWGYTQTWGEHIGTDSVLWTPATVRGGSATSTLYGASDSGRMTLSDRPGPGDEYDDWTTLHEYGHLVAYARHAFSHADSDSVADPHTLEAVDGSTMQAWDEGWAHYFAAVRLNFPNLPTSVLQLPYVEDGIPKVLEFNLETGITRRFIVGGGETFSLDVNDRGPMWEGSVAGALWDLEDAESDNPDGDEFADNLADGLHAVGQLVVKYSYDDLKNPCDFQRKYVAVWFRPTVTTLVRQVMWEHGIRSCGSAGDVTAVEAAEGVTEARLLGAFPNPGNPQICIRLAVPPSWNLRSTELQIFDVTGRAVAVLQGGRLPAGIHEIRWHGRTSSGEPASSGVYLYRVVNGSAGLTGKLTILR